MGLLVLLAVFTGDAANADGPAFAFVYAAFLAVVVWLFSAVRRHEREDRPEFVASTGSYVAGRVPRWP